MTLDPYSFLPSGPLLNKWIFETGGLFLEHVVEQKTLAEISSEEFTLVYVDGGELVGPSLVQRLKERYGRVVCYNIDDPYGSRDHRKWRLYLKSVPLYDVVFVVRECNLSEARTVGAQSAVLVSRAADEVAHSPRKLTVAERERWSGEVTFVGTWMPERGAFMAKLIELGLPLAIYGDRWRKAEQWPVLARHWRGSDTYEDNSYALAIQASRVCLGLLSKGNRDTVTTRSFEIPYLGGVLCAERTAEHLKLYRENEEAVFWSSPEECVAACTSLLDNEAWRSQVARNGRNRCIENGTTNEVVMAQIVSHAFAKSPERVDAFNSR